MAAREFIGVFREPTGRDVYPDLIVVHDRDEGCQPASVDPLRLALHLDFDSGGLVPRGSV